MTIVWRAIFVWLLLASSAYSQVPQTGVGAPAQNSTYVGPGDTGLSATAWWGLRAYNNASAVANSKFIKLTRLSDNVQCDFRIASNGGVGVSDAGCSLGAGVSIAAFAGQDATATCTIATTTATCSGASSTPHVQSTITGAGLTQPCYANAIGSFAGGAGTVTVKGVGSSPCGTIAVGETLTFTYGTVAATLYDQTGANSCSGTPCNLGSSNTLQPQYLPTCINTLPCLVFNGANNMQVGNDGGAMAAAFGTLNAVVGNVAATTEGHYVALASWEPGHSVGTNYGYDLDVGGTVGGVLAEQCFNNTCGDATKTQPVSPAWGVIGAVLASTTSRTAYTDAVAGTADTTSVTQPSPAEINLGAVVFGSTPTNKFIGFISEASMYGVLSGANMTTLCHNDFLYWGTAVSC